MKPDIVCELVHHRLRGKVKLDSTLYQKEREIFNSLFAEKTLDRLTASRTGAPHSMLTRDELIEASKEYSILDSNMKCIQLTSCDISN